ncbi:MAG: hypothetical protein KKE20_01160 [Nanoarchaeota archaeon]|nr:hypothetical protein [Nanoarchaeota archaeon]
MGDIRLLRKRGVKLEEAGAEVIRFEDHRIKDSYKRAIAHYREMIKLFHDVQDVIGKYIPNDASTIRYVNPEDMNLLRRLFYGLITHIVEAQKLLKLDRDFVWEKILRPTRDWWTGDPSEYKFTKDELLYIEGDHPDSNFVSGPAVEGRLKELEALLEKAKKKKPFLKVSVDKQIKEIDKIITETVTIDNLLKNDRKTYVLLIQLNREIEFHVYWNWFRSLGDNTTHPKDSHEKYGDQFDWPAIDKESMIIYQRMMRYVYANIHRMVSAVWYILKLLKYEIKNDEAIKYHINEMCRNYGLLLEMDEEVESMEEGEQYKDVFLGFPYGETDEKMLELETEFLKSLEG